MGQRLCIDLAKNDNTSNHETHYRQVPFDL